MIVQSRVPVEWRVPIAFAVLWIVPLLIAMTRSSWWERVSVTGAIFALALYFGMIGALLARSRPAWWTSVVLYVASIALWIQHIADHGLRVATTLWGLLMLVNCVLLVSAPMRRFVGLRGRLAAG